MRKFNFKNLLSKLDRSKRTSSFQPAIDGLRFFALLPVVFGHIIERTYRELEKHNLLQTDFQVSLYEHLMNMAPGVLLFFGISGYIIAHQFKYANYESLNKKLLLTYYIKRVVRIIPPYYFVIISTALLLAFLPIDLSSARNYSKSNLSNFESMMVSLVYSNGWLFGTIPKLYGPGWTLEIEMQFYIIAPFLLYSYFKVKDAYHRSVVALVLLSTSFVASHSLTLDFDDFHITKTIVKFLPYFLIGILAKDLSEVVTKSDFVKKILSIGGVTAVILFLFIKWPGINPTPYSWGYEFLISILIFTMLLSVSVDSTALYKFCSTYFVRIVGGACYSIYLTHQQVAFILNKIILSLFGLHTDPFVLAFASLIIEVPIILLVGMIFYLIIEKPFMSRELANKFLSKLGIS